MPILTCHAPAAAGKLRELAAKALNFARAGRVKGLECAVMPRKVMIARMNNYLQTDHFIKKSHEKIQ